MKKIIINKIGRLGSARDCSDWTLEPLRLWAEYAVVDERLKPPAVAADDVKEHLRLEGLIPELFG